MPTLHPIQENVASSDEETDYSTWKVVKIEFAHKSGSIVDMELLRSPEWIAENGFEVGSTFRAFAKEIETRGLGRVVGIEDAPEILPGEGSLVVGRYRTRENDELVTVYFANGLTLSGTKNHPVWLPIEEVWVGLGELEAGDRLLSRYGLVTVAQVTSHPAAPVYNISVQQQHVYEVTEWGIVVHNNDEIPWNCGDYLRLQKKSLDKPGSLTKAERKKLAAYRKHIKNFKKNMSPEVLQAFEDSKPLKMFQAHLHHILQKVGNSRKTKLAVVKVQLRLFKEFGFDAIMDGGNMVWAPLIAGMHGTKPTMEVVNALNEALDRGDDLDDILKILERFGDIAAKKKAPRKR